MDRVKLRPVRVDDAAPTLRVVTEIAQEGGMFLVSPEELRSVDEQREVIAALSPDDCWIVAEVGGEVVGFVDIRRGRMAKTRHTATLGIGVAKAYRGRGIGSLLLQAAEAWARRAGIRRIHFGVLAGNHRALLAYLKNGYQVEGCLPRQVREGDRYIDEYLVGKWLD